MGRTPDINSVIAGMIDRGAGQYYDTLTVGAGVTLANQYTLFTVPIGNADPITGNTKTKLQTNMTVSKQLPPPRAMVIMDMGFMFYSNMLKADIDAFVNSYFFEFRIDDKIQWEGFQQLHPSGLGVFGTTQNSGESSWQNGFPVIQNSRLFGDYSKYIAPLQQITATLTLGVPTAPTLTVSGSGGTGLNLKWILDGLWDRSVQ